MSAKEERILRSAARKPASDVTPSTGLTTSSDTDTWENSTGDEQHSNSAAPQTVIQTEGSAQPVASKTYPAPIMEDVSDNDTVVGNPDGGTDAVSISVLRAELDLQNAELERAQRAAEAARSRLQIARYEASSSAPPSNVRTESRIIGWMDQTGTGARDSRKAILPPPLPPPQNTAQRREEQPRSNFSNRDFELLSQNFADAMHRTRPASQNRNVPELPPFDGNITEWIAFRAEFEDSVSSFSDVGNISRLRKAMRGEAKLAVKSIMYTVTDPYEIIEALERQFGDPEEIILAEIQNVKKMPRLAEDNSNIQNFASHVANVVSTIKALHKIEFLYSPELVNKIADKMNLLVRYEWNKYRANNKQLPALEAIAIFLNEISSATRKTHARQRQPRTYACSANPAVCGGTPRGCSPTTSRARGSRQNFSNQTRSFENRYSDSDSEAEEYVKPRTVAQVKSKPPPRKPAVVVQPRQPQQTQAPTYRTKCIVCSGEHKLGSCADFTKLTIAQRWELAKNSKLCYRCLDTAHRKPIKCRYVACGVGQCEAGHHRLLHGLNSVAPARANVSSSVNHLRQANTYLKIVPVEITGPLGVVNTHALLDDGSSLTMIERHIADKVAPRTNSVPLSIEGVGGNVINDSNSCKVELRIRGACSRSLERLTAYTIDRLNLAAQTVDRDTIKGCEHLREIEDELCYDNAVPTVLVGQDHWNLLVSRQLRQGGNGMPVASLTSLGWILHGKHETDRKCSSSFVVNHVRPTATETEVLTLMKQHFDIESLGVESKVPKTDPDRRALEILESTCRPSGVKENAYEAGLLWRTETETLPNNKSLAESRLYSLEKKLDKDENLKSKYTEQIDNLLKKGYAEAMQSPPPLDAPRVFYLPHFPVFHAQKLKLRLVFDAASRAQGKCLNDALLTGPDLLQSLFGVLLRFREGKIGVIADVREMFLQIEVAERDRDSLRFLWRDGDRASQPKEYRMKSLIFGSACSPATALFIKNKNADYHGDRYPRAAYITKRNSYMDDFLIALDEPEEEAKQIINDVVELNSKASFELTGFASNHPPAISDVIDRSNLRDSPIGLKISDSERTLGLIWNHGRDHLGFNVNLRNTPTDVLEGKKLPTKRQITSSAMSIYDPLGYIAPISVIGKALIQDVWRTGIGWDDVIAPQSIPMWNNFIDNIKKLSEIKIDRYVPAYSREGELHIFCDASEKVYACAIYFVSRSPQGEVTSRLVAAKARVAPLKIISIPRLELQSCVLGVRLARSVKNETDYKINKCTYWSDSRTVLAWIKADPRTYKSFVAHRLAEIEDLSTPTEWRWVPSASNVADDATKGVPVDFGNQHRWFFGPPWLLGTPNKYPIDSSAPTPATPTGEERPRTVLTVKQKDDFLPIASRFSSYFRLVRAAATVLCVVEVFKAMSRKEAHDRQVNNDHMRLAEILLIRRSQRVSFHEEIRRIERNEALPRGSALKRTAVKLDSNKMLILDARVDRKTHHPVLHAKEEFTKLLIAHFHRIFLHANHKSVMNELSQRYHIVGLRSALRHISSKCQWCRTHKALPPKLPMGDLPPERLTAHQPPFTAAACDYFGPFIITIGRRREKRWGALFTCLTTRAVHLELAASLSASSFIMALRRMMARRGTPTIFYSDNGTNFIGGEREIEDALRAAEPEMKNFMDSKKITWKKILPGNPAAGGAWERMIGCVKTALRATLKDRSPTEEVLHTLLLEAEHITNSRPLTPVTTDNSEALTPNHFLLGRSNAMSPFGYFSEAKALSHKHWHFAQQLADHYWQRWVREYRPLLKTRCNPQHLSTKNLQVGDIVIIADGTMPRGTWPRGEIIKVFPGPDGIVRATEVRTVAGQIRRPACRLILVSGKASVCTRGGISETE